MQSLIEPPAQMDHKHETSYRVGNGGFQAAELERCKDEVFIEIAWAGAVGCFFFVEFEELGPGFWD